jgi:hypothetical protein
MRMKDLGAKAKPLHSVGPQISGVFTGSSRSSSGKAVLT